MFLTLLGCARSDSARIRRRRRRQVVPGRCSAAPSSAISPTRSITGIPDNWSIKKGKEKNIKWSAKLGTQSPRRSRRGRRPYLRRHQPCPRPEAGDKGVLMCFREADGKFLWQAVHDKLAKRRQRRQGTASPRRRAWTATPLLCQQSLGSGLRRRRRRRRQGQDPLVARHDQGVEGLSRRPGRQFIDLFASDRGRSRVCRHRQRRRRRWVQCPHRKRRASSPSTRTPARWSGRTTRPARKSWMANGPTRRRPRSTDSGR